MFGLLKKSPLKGLQKEHQMLVTKAFNAQRNGDIRGYSTLTAEAETLRQQIEKLESDSAGRA
jgi:cell division protein FtsB